jgi:chromate transporter
VIVLAACGVLEATVRTSRRDGPGAGRHAATPLVAVPAAAGGLGALAWVALKVGLLSYGGGFVIVPLMQHDAVHTYHWMTAGQFLDAVALGQITPGPVVQTVAVVGYAAAGIAGGLLAAFVAFAPSFAFILVGGPHFDRLRTNPWAQGFLTGAGSASIGAIAGSTVPLALALSHLWQLGVLAAAALWLLAFRRGVITALVAAALVGVAVAYAGLPLPA